MGYPHFLITVSKMTLATNSMDKDAERENALKLWLQESFPNANISIDSLPGDASFRRYHRLTITSSGEGVKAAAETQKPEVAASVFTSSSSSSSSSNTRHYIVMDAPPSAESIKEFIAVDELLAPFINVPNIIAKDVDQGFLVLQDFGSTEFAHLVADADTAQVNHYYQQALDTLIALQDIDIDHAREQAQLPDYDEALLNREMDLFSEWFLPYVGLALTDELSQQRWQAFKQIIIKQVLTQPQVVVHRDYHSRNLMQDCNDDKRLGVIDFQDAVIGAYSYDVVSLLRDAYVSWPDHQIEKWLQYYTNNRTIDQNLKTFDRAEQLRLDVMIMGIQRHLKILGIFVRLSERDGKRRYLADIPKVMQDLIIELDWLSKTVLGARDQDAVISEHSRVTDVDVNSKTADLVDFKQWFDQVVLPAFYKKFATPKL